MYEMMLESFGYVAGFSIMVFISYLIILVLGLLISTIKKTNSHAQNYLSLLYSVNTREIILLNAQIIRILYLIWLVAYQVIFFQIYLIMYLLMLLINVIVLGDFKRIITTLINGIFTLICLYVMSLLLDYNTQIYFLWTNQVIYYLLSAFVIIFNIIEMLKEFGNISTTRRFKLDNEELD